MTAYMVARTTITDRAKFDNDFMPAIRHVMESYNAKLIAQSDHVETVHGDEHSMIGSISHLAILEFESIDIAHDCAKSEAFKHAMAIAGGCMVDHYVRLIDGMPATAAEHHHHEEQAKSGEEAAHPAQEPAAE